jgi:hypothetical protein
MGSLRTSVLIALATLAAITPRAARADARGVVRLGGSCVPPGTSLEATLRILRAELSPLPVEALAGAPGAADDVLVAIDGCTMDPPSAHLTIWFRGGSREQAVSLADAEPDARDRSFALAIAEAAREAPSLATRGPGRGEAPPGGAAITSVPGAMVPGAMVPGAMVPGAMVPGSALEVPSAGHLPATPPRDRTVDDRDVRAAAPSIEPRVSALFRVVPSPSTVLVGADVGLAWRRAGIGVAGFGTERAVAIGRTTLLAFAAAPWVTVVELVPGVSIRAGAELGIAVASATATDPAHATPANAPHLAADVGLAGTLGVGAGFTLDGFVGAGYASSLTVTADGRDVATLGGAFVTMAIGVRVPLTP